MSRKPSVKNIIENISSEIEETPKRTPRKRTNIKTKATSSSEKDSVKKVKLTKSKKQESKKENKTESKKDLTNTVSKKELTEKENKKELTKTESTNTELTNTESNNTELTEENKNKSKSKKDLLKELYGHPLNPQEKEIFDYLTTLSRPGGTTETITNFRGKINKPELLKIMEAMKLEGYIEMKPNKKTHVFCPINPVLSEQEKLTLKKKLEQHEAEEKILDKKIKEFRLKIKKISTEKSLKEILKEAEEQTKQTQKLKKESEKFTGKDFVGVREHTKILKTVELNKKTVKKCKIGFKELKANICEGLGKKWEEINEEIGLED